MDKRRNRRVRRRRKGRSERRRRRKGRRRGGGMSHERNTREKIPTVPFTISGPRDQEIGEFFVAREPHAIDFESPKL